ncbi:hypothetical protein [Shewanella halifaxensis]|uniref:hypothetical protein n=1 Tax=Shewanella halifaxensis TaxID=271098 RepID=UPI0002FB045C|nr:hypothetical protein [Shewanella halifaxensis]
MKTSLLSKPSGYYWASLIMFLGLIYNVIEQDLFGSAIFLISSAIFLSVGFVKGRA